MLELVCIALAAALGILAVRCARPVEDLGPAWAARAFETALGAGAGIGGVSVLFFLLLLAGIGKPIVLVLIQVALGVVFFLRRSRKRPAVDNPANPFRWTWAVTLAFAIVLLIDFSALFEMASAAPHGEWDAWAIWNVRAKFLAGPAESWRNAISPLLTRTHPDYPLLLSGFIGSVWKTVGETSTIVPAATSFLFLTATLALLASAMTLLRGTVHGALAALLLLSTPAFLIQTVSQYADLPLAFYYLGAIVLAQIGPAPALVWAGVCASFAAWTKNEGFVFLAILLAVYRSRAMLFGALPGALLVGGFRLLLAPAADPLFHQKLGEAAARAVDWKRYGQIAKSMVTETGDLGNGVSHPLILILILLIALRWRPIPMRPVMAIASTFVAYCGVYLLTPEDLGWRLSTSMGRLIAQVWPSLLFLAVLGLGPTLPQTSAPAHPKAAPPAKQPARPRADRRASTSGGAAQP